MSDCEHGEQFEMRLSEPDGGPLIDRWCALCEHRLVQKLAARVAELEDYEVTCTDCGYRNTPHNRRKVLSTSEEPSEGPEGRA